MELSPADMCDLAILPVSKSAVNNLPKRGLKFHGGLWLGQGCIDDQAQKKPQPVEEGAEVGSVQILSHIFSSHGGFGWVFVGLKQRPHVHVPFR